MDNRFNQLIKPLAYFIAISATGAASANSNEIWGPNPEKFENVIQAGEAHHMDDHSSNMDKQSQENGEMTIDVELFSQESGIPLAAAERAIRAQEAFARYADRVIARYPDKIARMWNEPAPSTKSHIQFVGKVPDTIIQDIFQKKVPHGLSIKGGATIPLKAQHKRAEAAAKGLRKAGYVNSSSFYDPATDRIQLDIKVPDHARNPDPQKILNAIQNELRGTELRDHIRSLTGKSININTIRGEGPIMELDHARGGNWLRDDGFRECTSGWSVSGPHGDGIITAAHCSGLNQFEEESGLIFPMTWRSQVFSLLGDVEYHTTSHIELDDFYARPGEIRDVSGIRSTWTMPGATVCEYGRSNNIRTCNHTVQAINVIVNYSIGTVGNLVRVSGDDSIGGDSGGGWSFNYTAWGVHSGSNGIQSFFTPAQQAEAVLGVTIKR